MPVKLLEEAQIGGLLFHCIYRKCYIRNWRQGWAICTAKWWNRFIMTEPSAVVMKLKEALEFALQHGAHKETVNLLTIAIKLQWIAEANPPEEEMKLP